MSQSKKNELDSPSRRRFIKTAAAVSTGIATGGAGLAFILKPSDAGAAYSPYFSKLNTALKEAGLGRPCIVLDLDRVDHNISRVKHWLGKDYTYRVVTKSLPSFKLIQYVLEKSDSNHLMAFHQPYLELFVSKFESSDILLGKPMLIAAVEEFYNNIPQKRHSRVSRQIQWLVDTEVRLNHYLKIAKEKNVRLRINLEIDIGLHRGGVADYPEFDNMLALIAANGSHLEFTGLMGYEAHVRHAPPVISSVDSAFSNAMLAYKRFYNRVKDKFPELFHENLTFNSGGSTTYQLFNDTPEINDIAAGSCMVKPSSFQMLEDHKPALFIAAPVLKKLEGPQVAFLDFASGLLQTWDVNMENALYLYGGGWAAEQVSPPGVKMNPLTAGPLNQNLLPNQSLFNCSNSVDLGVGDFVFFHPQQGDAAFQFEEIRVTRSGRLLETWKPLPKRF